MGNPDKHTLFNPSGCLSPEGLSLYASGRLTDEEEVLVLNHLSSCELCSLAVEGYAMSNPGEFEESLALIHAAFSDSEAPEPVSVDIPETAEGFEGPRFPRMSPEEIREFNRQILQKSADQAEATSAGSESATGPVKSRSLSGKYRTELIAAALLLLFGLGARWLYVEFNQSGSLNNYAEAPESGNPALQADPDTVRREKLNMEPEPVSRAKSRHNKVEVKQKLTLVERNEVAAPDEIILSEADTDADVTASDVTVSEKPLTALMSGEKPKREEKSGSIVRIPLINDSEAEDTTRFIDGVMVKKEKSARTKLSVPEEEAAVFTVVEEPPQYPGGDTAMLNFMMKNINYPPEAREAGIQGTVFVTFVIKKDGTLTDINLLRGIGGGCDEEAIRVMKIMPRWKPGTQRGKPVRVRMTLPVKFKLAR